MLFACYLTKDLSLLRPSGTEPKIKLYVSLKCPNFDDVAQKLMR